MLISKQIFPCIKKDETKRHNNKNEAEIRENQTEKPRTTRVKNTRHAGFTGADIQCTAEVTVYSVL